MLPKYFVIIFLVLTLLPLLLAQSFPNSQPTPHYSSPEFSQLLKSQIHYSSPPPIQSPRASNISQSSPSSASQISQNHQTITIYNKKTNEIITEPNFLIELPKINEQISVQKAKSVSPIIINDKKNKLESGIFQASELIDLTQEQEIPWGVERVNAPKVWNKTRGDKIKIAVLDTGIDYNHPDLNLNIAGGINFIDSENSNDYMDYVGHGTAVAGIISALDNEIGVVGVSPEAELYAVKVMDEEGGYLIDVLEGIDWAIENDMDVISMSFGSKQYSQALEYKLAEAYESGIILIAASGNTEEDVWYPAKYPSVIAVGNTDINNELFYSNFGPDLELVAPGTEILTTYLDNEYVVGSGTSFSAPHVAGVVALLLNYNSSMVIEDIRTKLFKDAIDLGDEGKDDLFGYGLVQVKLPYAKIIITMPNMSEQEYNSLEIKVEKLEVYKIEEGGEDLEGDRAVDEKVLIDTVIYDSNIENYSLEVEPGEYIVRRYVRGRAGAGGEEIIEEEYVEIAEGEIVVVPLYQERLGEREFIVDAPWRITVGNNIPILFEIRDSDGVGYAYSFYSVKIFDENNNSNLVKEFSYFDLGLPKDDSCFGSDYATITERVWYKLMYIDSNLFVKDINNNIKIIAEYDGSICGGDGDASPDNEPYPLTVYIDDEDIPKFSGWYCGDTHYHSSYTDTKFYIPLPGNSKGEFGGPIESTINMLNAIGLDWVTVTDHSNSFSNHKNDELNWNNFKTECNNYGKCLIGTEINCDYSLSWWDVGGGGNHLLAYDYSEYIEDDFWWIIGHGNPTCAKIILNVSGQGGFSYAAHPEMIMDPFGIILETWHDYSLPFTGLQLWNSDIVSNKDNEEALESGLTIWTSLLLQGRRVFISAGSDAHGDFQEFGREYTCCKSSFNSTDPEFKQSIFTALKNGNCYMGNNGALKFTAENFYSYNGKFDLGEEMNITKGETVGILVSLGSVNDCVPVLYRGTIGEAEEIIIEENEMEILDVLYKNSYYRAECISPDNKSRIYTNPIWVNVQERKLNFNVYINEVELNPPWNDSGNKWVELYNYGLPINLNGWYLTDRDNNQFPLPDISVNDFYVLNNLDGLVNENENISLFNNNDVLIDNTGPLSDNYNNDRTRQRIPDGDGDFIIKTETKNSANEPETMPPKPMVQGPEPTISFTISPSLNFNSVKPGQDSSIINSTITISQTNNQNFTLNIELISNPNSIFSNIFFDLNHNQEFEPNEQLNNTLTYSVIDSDSEQIIDLPVILKIPAGFLPGQHSGTISYTVVGEVS